MKTILKIEGVWISEEIAEQLSNIHIESTMNICTSIEEWIQSKTEKLHQMLLKPLSESDLTVRCFNCLRAAGFTTLKEVFDSSTNPIVYPQSHIRKLRNMGMRSIHELETLRILYNYDWKEE